MRISDAMMSKNYLTSINDLKKKIENLNKHVSTQQKILSPSDSPTGIAKLLSLNKKVSETETYIKNLQEGKTFIQETINGMEAIQSQVSDAITIMTEINDESKNDALGAYADKIDSILNSILSNANNEFEGKYIFGGTDYKSNPYGLSSDGNYVSTLVDDNSGKQEIKITSSTKQEVNVSGREVFGTIIQQSGTIDSSTAVGGTVASSTKVYDASGNQYDMNLTYTKTAANTYDLTYNIVDSGGTTVYTSPSPTEVVFDSATGKLKTVGGSEKGTLHVLSSSNKMDFTIDLFGTKEAASASSLSYEANQDRDIFNVLISIRNNLRNGIKPSEADKKAVNDFNLRLLDKLAGAGNTLNQLNNTEELLGNQKNLLVNLAAKENDVDVAEAILDLQNQDYLLQLSYKMSAMILPKSLVDYL
jgi:flagellar hook-associated protein 3